MDPVSALQTLYTVAKMIYAAADGAKGNQKQCATLKGRIQVLEADIRRKEKSIKVDHLSALSQLTEAFNGALDLIQRHSSKSFLMQMLLYKNAKDAFDQCNRLISDCVTDFHLSFTMNIVAQEDQRAAEQDSVVYEKLITKISRDPQETKKLIAADDSAQLLATMKALEQEVAALKLRDKADAYLLDQTQLQLDVDARGRLKKIGSGAFGTVYTGTYHGSRVAVKELEMSVKASKVKEDVQCEVALVAPLYHAHIVRMLGYVIEDGERAQLVMEFLTGGSLHSRIFDGKYKWSREDKLTTMSQIVSGMVYLHSIKPNPILHRDLKSANIMFDADGRVRIIDFGLARAKEGSRYATKGGVSTLRYCAPELFDGAQFTQAADVFAFGVIVYELATGLQPYTGVLDQAVAKAARDGRLGQEASKLSESQFASLISSCVSYGVESRPSFAQIRALLQYHTIDSSIKNEGAVKVVKNPLQAAVSGSAVVKLQELQRRAGTSMDMREQIVQSELTHVLVHLRSDNLEELTETLQLLQMFSGMEWRKDEGDLSPAFDKLRRQIADAGCFSELIKLLPDSRGAVAELSAGCLHRLARVDEKKVSIAAAGAIQPLIQLLSSGSDGAKHNAAVALRNLALNAENKVSIAAGAIKPLIQLLLSGSDGAKENAAGALRNLAVNAENKVSIAAAGAIKPLIQLLSSGSDGAKNNAAAALAGLLSTSDQIRGQVVSEGGLLPLAAVFKSSAGETKKLAATALDKIRLTSILAAQVNTSVGGKALLDSADKY